MHISNTPQFPVREIKCKQKTQNKKNLVNKL